MATTRRLTAILAADVAGYSRLMGADEESTHHRLRAHFAELVEPKISEHNGRTVKNTGDGLLAEFPSVVEAVRCAVEIQRGMIGREPEVREERRIRFRIGVNLGDVIAEDNDIFGDGVNVAARLEALAEPGGICISRTVRDQIRDKLPYSLEDLGEQTIKNIARPVRVYRLGVGALTGLSAEPPAAAAKAPLQLPDKPSVAVLPFANMSSDPEQEFFADGISEDIITALSRYPSLFVIARNSSFTYRGQSVDVKQVGRELGVRYVLEGSLRKSGSRIRVTAQLVEAEASKHVWAERYDRDLADIFAVQDEITEAVTIPIVPTIADAELKRAMRRPAESLDAWAACQRGRWHLSKRTLDDLALAEKLFQKAIDLDPGFAGGYTGLASVHATTFDLKGTRPSELNNLILALARQAIALDPRDAEARSCLGNALRLVGDYNGAVAEAQRALTINPNLTSAYDLLGATLIVSGQPKEGLAALENCVRLDPCHPNLASRLMRKAMGLYFLREYERSAEAAQAGIRLFPDLPNNYRWLAAALGQVGRIEEANEALEKAIAVAPAAFEMYVRQRVPWHRQEDYAHMLEGLRKAGMPEE
jgi:adenylate cyclase